MFRTSYTLSGLEVGGVFRSLVKTKDHKHFGRFAERNANGALIMQGVAVIGMEKLENGLPKLWI